MKANPRPHGKKPLSCLPFDAYRAIINLRGGETVGIAKIAEDVRHWVKQPDRQMWQDDYDYKVLSKAEFDTFSAMGIPVLKVKYRPIKMWLTKQRGNPLQIRLMVLFYTVFIMAMVVDNILDNYPGDYWIQSVPLLTITFTITALVSFYIIACMWADDHL